VIFVFPDRKRAFLPSFFVIHNTRFIKNREKGKGRFSRLDSLRGLSDCLAKLVQAWARYWDCLAKLAQAWLGTGDCLGDQSRY